MTISNLEPEVQAIKNQLVDHLKTRRCSDVHALWGETKAYFKNKLIDFGGSYASWSDYISVSIKIDETKHRFQVTLKEIKTK